MVARRRSNTSARLQNSKFPSPAQLASQKFQILAGSLAQLATACQPATLEFRNSPGPANSLAQPANLEFRNSAGPASQLARLTHSLTPANFEIQNSRCLARSPSQRVPATLKIQNSPRPANTVCLARWKFEILAGSLARSPTRPANVCVPPWNFEILTAQPNGSLRSPSQLGNSKFSLTSQRACLPLGNSRSPSQAACLPLGILKFSLAHQPARPSKFFLPYASSASSHPISMHP